MGRSGIAVLALAALALLAPPALAAPLDRPDDPVVITGAGVPSLGGAAPGKVLAFAWSGSWDQIPVQVDERKLFDLRVAYPTPFAAAATAPATRPSPRPRSCATPIRAPGWARTPTRRSTPTTRSPSWPGTPAPRPARVPDPAGVVAGSRVEIKVTDPLDGGAGYVYLFRQTGSLDPGAGEQYVTYSFSLASGAYPSTYKYAAGHQHRDLDRGHAPLHAPLHRPLAGERAEDPARAGPRRHPRPQREPVHSRLLRAQPADLRRRRGRVPGQPQRARPRRSAPSWARTAGR